jgi:glycosyltransferase involved in cell wall biosynthesis
MSGSTDNIIATNRLRVVHTVLQLDTGGMEKLLVEFARHADRSRFDLHFVSLTTRGRVADEIEALGWPVTALREPAGLRPGMVLRMRRLFRSLGADVVHAHNSKPLIYCGPAARLARVPAVVYTRHGTRRGARRGETLLYRLAVHTAHRAVCVSDDSARLCRRDGVSAGRVRKIWNGIDTARFSFTGPAADGPAVMVGRLSPEKNVETLLRAVPMIWEARPDFRLEIAGDGPCMADLRRLAEELRLGDRVTFLGDVRDVPALMARASLCVLPSLTEGISLVLLEAMARGLPVVATRVGGNPEVVADEETGVLVPPSEPDRLAAAILRVYGDPVLGRRMGEAGRRRVEAHFDVRQMVAGYESLYWTTYWDRRGGAPAAPAAAPADAAPL